MPFRRSLDLCAQDTKLLSHPAKHRGFVGFAGYMKSIFQPFSLSGWKGRLKDVKVFCFTEGGGPCFLLLHTKVIDRLHDNMEKFNENC